MAVDVVLFLHGDLNAIKFCVMFAQKKTAKQIAVALSVPESWIAAYEQKMRACGIIHADGSVDADALKYANSIAANQIKKVM